MHEKFEDLMLLYTTHSISADQLAELQSHLAQCSQCRQSLNEWRAIAAAVKARAQEKAYLQEQTPMTTRLIPRQSQRRERPLATALALVAILFIVVLLFAHRPSLPNVAPQLLLQSTSEPTIYADLVIAARPIENGSVIHEDDVMIYPIPLASARFLTMTSLDDVVNTIARRNITCGHQILQTDLATNARDVPDDQLAFREQAYSCADGALERLVEPIEYVDVIIAEQFIQEGAVVRASDLATVQYPAQLTSSISLMNLDDVVGHTTRTNIYPEEIIISDYVHPRIIPTDVPGTVITNTPRPQLTPTQTATPEATFATMPQAVCQLNFEAENAPIRAYPDENADILYQLSGTATLNVVGITFGLDNQSWYYVYTPTNMLGWLHSDVVTNTTCQTLLSSTATPMVITTTPRVTPIYTPTLGLPLRPTFQAICQATFEGENIPVRGVPDENAVILGQLSGTRVLDVVGLSYGLNDHWWYHVYTPLHVLGWIDSDAVTDSNCQQFLIVTATPNVITATPARTPLPVYTVTPGVTLTPISEVLCQVEIVDAGVGLNVRAEPRLQSQIIGFVDQNTVIEVVDLQTDNENYLWYRVRLRLENGVGFEGWVRSDTVRQSGDRPCPTIPPATPEVTSTPVPTALCQVVPDANTILRSSPSTTAERIGIVSTDTVMDVIDLEAGDDNRFWYHVFIRLNSGTAFDGWIQRDIVQQSGSTPCPVLP